MNSVSYSPLNDRSLDNLEKADSANTSNTNVPLLLNTSAPLAKSEIDDDGPDNREVVTKPYPGVDDGFFIGTEKNDGKHPDVETIDHDQPKPDFEIPIHPESEPAEPPIEIPDIFNRFGDDDNNAKPDAVDGKTDPNSQPLNPPSVKTNNHVPGFGPGGFGRDFEIGSLPGDFESIPDVNVYQHKKTLAQGMFDLALFSANANQLRYVLESFARHPYFYPSIIFISISLILQICVGIGLIWNATYNVKDEKEICIANKINNFTIIGIFLITVINVFISAFGVANAPTAT